MLRSQPLHGTVLWFWRNETHPIAHVYSSYPFQASYFDTYTVFAFHAHVVITNTATASASA
jgi:hypothetical protein